jgi:hypothetical protein
MSDSAPTISLQLGHFRSRMMPFPGNGSASINQVGFYRLAVDDEEALPRLSPQIMNPPCKPVGSELSVLGFKLVEPLKQFLCSTHDILM